jgi:DNA-binding response OmpR family regulator
MHVTDSKATVLIVDDDVEFAQSAADYAHTHGSPPILAYTLEQSRNAMKRDGNRGLLLLVLSFPDSLFGAAAAQAGLASSSVT